MTAPSPEHPTPRDESTTSFPSLKEWRYRAQAGGGAQRVAQQKQAGKLTARERLELLLDRGSFREIDRFVRQRQHGDEDGNVQGSYPLGEGVVTGQGLIEGRLVYCFSQDFTVFGGSVGELHARKICKVMDLAYKSGAPLIGINDSGGARIQEGVDSLGAYGEIFSRNAHLSGVIPQISVILGPCAGGAVYSPALTDFTFVAESVSRLFITGPQVTKAATGEDVSFEQLGGAAIHASKSGVAHFISEDEPTCLAAVRRLLSYLPGNNLQAPPVYPPPSVTNAPTTPEQWEKLLPRQATRSYDVRRVITALCDEDSFLEVHARYAPNAVVGFSRFGGQCAGVVANQPAHLAGCLDIDASDKISRFVRFCDAFNVPLITLVDVPGFLPGVTQEHGGIIRHGAKILYAYAEATVPKLAVILRKAYGGAYVAMSSRSLGADLSLAWPHAEIAVMGPEGAAQILYRSHLARADDPEAELERQTAQYRRDHTNPYVACARGMIDDVIEPHETRDRLLNALSSLAGKREDRPAKKHGNIPL